MSERLAIAERRQLLLTRAALERVEMGRALEAFREARRPVTLAARMLLRPRAAGLEGGIRGLLAQGLALFRQHPYLGSALSLAFGAMRGGGAGRLLRRAGLLAALAAAGVWALRAAASESGAESTSKPAQADDPTG